MRIAQIPTHFRFLNEEDAVHWDRTTKEWIPIKQIHIEGDEDGIFIKIAAASFAWIFYDSKKPNLEFRFRKLSKKEIKEFLNEP